LLLNANNPVPESIIRVLALIILSCVIMKAKPKSRQELANEYNVNIRTFMKWLENEGITLSSGLLCPRKVEEIYSKLGEPPKKMR